MKIKCLKCKGRYPEKYCGKEFCPLIPKIKSINEIKKKSQKTELDTQSPTIFVGRFGYPKVNLGILGLSEKQKNPDEFDNPNKWAEKNLEIDKIISMRARMINSLKKVEIKRPEKLTQIGQEIAMSSRSPEVEISLKEKPKFSIKTSFDLSPYGPQGKLKNIHITKNPRIPRKISKIYDDTDFKANNAMNQLYQDGFSENKISRILSSGALGVKIERKLVPTRWSITATDDSLGKNLIKEIKKYPTIEKPMTFFGSHLGNYFIALCFPDVWSYELFETYANEKNFIETINQYTTDFEFYQGRKEYAHQCAGGYYAARLAILEKLNQMKKQASVLLLRFITSDYYVPLGVWVVRESVRNCMKSKPIVFDDKKLMLTYAMNKCKKDFYADISYILNQSKILNQIKKQRKLFEFE